VNKITIAISYSMRGVVKMLLLSFCMLTALPSFTFYYPQKATRQTAVAAYEKNDHEQALRQFSELSASYPKDPLYKYYCGVCLVKLNREPSRAFSLLSDALTGSATIITVPDDGIFWLGRAQQMTGRFSEAIASFQKFAGQAGKKIAKEMNVPDYIKQCQEKKGLVGDKDAETVTKAPEENKTAEVNEPAVAVTHVPPEDPSGTYDSLLTVALSYQLRSDSLYDLVGKLNTQMNLTEVSARNELKFRVQNTEKLALENRNKAEAAMAEAGKLNLTETSQDTEKAEPVVVSEPLVPDTIIQVKTAPVQPIVVIPDKEIFSEFEIIEKPVYKPDEKVTINPDVPPGLVYRLQVAVFKNPVAPSYFKGITPVQGFRNPANGITTYYAGVFRRSADASKALVKVRGLGFKDSFVSALMDKKSVSPDRAAVFEKEWGTKPLYTVKPAAPDTVPKTLVFRVEVKRSPKPLPGDQIENMKKMAGSRGLDIIVNEKKISIYLAGKFLTFKSASEYADLLIRNGYRDSKVVAYLGNSEVPVETAKQLFDEH
jgi:hypothetical protein